MAALRHMEAAFPEEEMDEPQVLARYVASHGGAWPLPRSFLEDSTPAAFSSSSLTSRSSLLPSKSLMSHPLSPVTRSPLPPSLGYSPIAQLPMAELHPESVVCGDATVAQSQSLIAGSSPVHSSFGDGPFASKARTSRGGLSVTPLGHGKVSIESSPDASRKGALSMAFRAADERAEGAAKESHNAGCEVTHEARLEGERGAVPDEFSDFEGREAEGAFPHEEQRNCSGEVSGAGTEAGIGLSTDHPVEQSLPRSPVGPAAGDDRGGKWARQDGMGQGPRGQLALLHEMGGQGASAMYANGRAPGGVERQLSRLSSAGSASILSASSSAASGKSFSSQTRPPNSATGVTSIAGTGNPNFSGHLKEHQQEPTTAARAADGERGIPRRVVHNLRSSKVTEPKSRVVTFRVDAATTSDAPGTGVFRQAERGDGGSFPNSSRPGGRGSPSRVAETAFPRRRVESALSMMLSQSRIRTAMKVDGCAATRWGLSSPIEDDVTMSPPVEAN